MARTATRRCAGCIAVLAMRGELASAEAEVRRARAELATSGPFCEGDACRVLGEIRLALELGAAQAVFEQVGATPYVERCRALRAAR